ncbi:MAG: DNA polymerase III subunit delta [Bacteroidota bacterium]
MASTKKHGIPFQEFQDAIKRKDIAPIYFFFGEEEYLLERALEMLKHAVLDDLNSGFNLDVLYGGDVDGNDIISFASMFPMMGERNMVIVRDFDKLPDKDKLLSYLDHPSPTTILVIIAAEPDFRLKIYKALETKSVTVGFEQLKDYQIPGWLKNTIQASGKTISEDAIQLLHTCSDRSLRKIQNEIDKLYTYIGDRNNITVEDVNAVTGVTREFNVFELNKTLGSKDLVHALDIVSRMLETGESPSYILASVTKYFQKLWVVQEILQKKRSIQEIAKFLNMNPAYTKYAEEYANAAAKYTNDEFEGVFSSLVEADRRLKLSDADMSLIMTVLVYKIINKQESMHTMMVEHL